MDEFWIVAFPILLVDVANPVLLAATILAVTTKTPYASSLAVIAGHTAAYFLVGVLIVFGLGDIIGETVSAVWDYLSKPDATDFIYSLAVGIFLLVVALFWRTKRPRPSENPPEPSSPGMAQALLFGAIINFIGIPFALPYFGVLGQLMKQDIGPAFSNLAVYNIAYAVPFLLVPAALAVFGKGIMPLLSKINDIVEKYSAYILPFAFGLLGLFLVVDAVLFFVGGNGLI